MKTYLQNEPGPWLSVACWCVFAVMVAALIMGGPSIDNVIFGR